MSTNQIYTSTGWHKNQDNQPVYITQSGALGATGLNQTAPLNLPSDVAGYSLPAPPVGNTLKESVQISLDFLKIAPLSITVPLLASMVAAPLTPFQALNAVVWLYGPPQTYKTTLSHLALSHFGPSFTNGKSTKKWTATQADLHTTMFNTKDMPLIIDDYSASR